MSNVIYGPSRPWYKILEVHSISYQGTIYYWFCFEGKTYYKSLDEIKVFATENKLNIEYVHSN